MLTIVSHIKEHITTTEFWRALSFVLKRLESIAKYLTQLPLPFTIIFYSLHGVRASLRIVHYVKKTKNKNLGETCKFLFSVFKVLIALIAFALLASGFGSLPTALLTAFFSYTVLKLVHSTAVLLASTVFALNMNKSRIEQQWALWNYRCNINKHAALLSTGLLFVSVMYLSTRSRLMWTNPLLLLIDGVVLLGIGATIGYIAYKIIKNKRIDGEILIGREHSVQCLKKVLFFGLPSIALLLIILTPGLGISMTTAALIVLCAQDIVLTIYYYFFDSIVPDPKPAYLSDPPHQDFWKTSWDYYRIFSPIYYLKTQISDQFPSMTEVNQTNKKLLLKMTIIKLLHIESTLEKIEKLGKIGRLILSQKKHQIKKKYLLRELAWVLNTDDQEVLIDLFIRTLIDLAKIKQFKYLYQKLDELLELFDKNNQTYLIPKDKNCLKKNTWGQLFFLARQMKSNQVPEMNKPKLFYQSFWKKMGACEVLSHAFKASRAIEEQISLVPLS